MKYAVVLPIASLFIASIARAQTDQRSANPPTAITVQATVVLVPALVRDKSSEIVFGLTAGDFILTDDGVPQKLSLQQDSDGEPLALVVVLEAGAANKSAGWQPDSRGAPKDRFHSLPTLVDAIVGNVPHRVAVVGFDSHPEVLQGFTSNFASVTDAIEDFTSEDVGDHGAAILDSLGFAVDLLRTQPSQYRRAILLLSETNDRGSALPLADAIRAITVTNTAIYSVAYSTGYTEASQYGGKQLPTKRIPPKPDPNHPNVDLTPPNAAPASVATAILQGLTTGIVFGNPEPYPGGGCMAKDVATTEKQKKASRAYDCLAQLAPPLALVKMAAIATVDGMHRNIPETIAKLTGGEYFKFNDARSLERDLVAISNHVPNRYVLSFQPQSPHVGLHVISLKLKGHAQVTVTARSSYWADPPPADSSQR